MVHPKHTGGSRPNMTCYGFAIELHVVLLLTEFPWINTCFNSHLTLSPLKWGIFASVATFLTVWELFFTCDSTASKGLSSGCVHIVKIPHWHGAVKFVVFALALPELPVCFYDSVRVLWATFPASAQAPVHTISGGCHLNADFPMISSPPSALSTADWTLPLKFQVTPRTLMA